MKTIGINDNLGLLSRVPKPPVYLTEYAKEHYRDMAKKLIKIERLKEVYLPALEVYAESMACWEWALREIKRKNKMAFGSGYIQTYSSGATNITTEMVMMRNAKSDILDCAKIFGLQPDSDKKLKSTTDPNQGNLFDELQKKLNNG